MATKRIYIHPNNLEEIRQYFPLCFAHGADSNEAEHSGIVVGSVIYDAYQNQYQQSYISLGKGESDFLEKIDEDIPRICCYLDNFDTEVVDGIRMPYLDIYDDADKKFVGGARGGLTIKSEYEDNPTNLKQTSYNGVSYCTWDANSYFDTLDEAKWNYDNVIVNIGTGGLDPVNRVLFSFSDKYAYSEAFIIDAFIPIFVDEESARDYIETGNVQAGKCFNLDNMMLSEPTLSMISTKTYEYDADKNCTREDSDTHTLYIRTFEGQAISGYVRDDGSKYNIQLNIQQKSSNIDTIQYRVGSGTFETITIADFMNSQYAKGFNTWREFEPYGISGFVKGNLWRSTINICASEADSNLWNNGQKDKVVPLNFDAEGNPVNMSDTGTPAHSEDDLNDEYKDGASGLITLYQLSKSNLVTLGNAIFDTSSSIGDTIKDALSAYGDSPINAIVSVFHTPIDISRMCQLSQDSLVRLGLYNLTCEGAETVIRYGKLLTLGSTTINPFYNDFRDYQNFRFELHLPFSSPLPLQADEIMNKTLTIKCTCDAYSMQLRYYICVDNIVVKTVDCAFGHQIAIMGNDFAGKNKEVAQQMFSLASSGIGLATGTLQQVETANQIRTTVNLGNMMGSAAGMQGSLNAITKEAPKTMVGSFASGCAECDCLYPYLTIYETDSIKPDNLASTYGRPTNIVGRIGNVSGFTCAELVRLECDCLESERDEILSLLNGGIII